MRFFLKLIFLLALSSFLYPKVITNSATISYLFGDESYSHQLDSTITILDESPNGDALSMRKTAQKIYAEDNSSLGIELSVVVTVNRYISNLVIGDEIADGYAYQDGTLLLNSVAPESFLLLDSALSLSVGDVREGEVYSLVYIVREVNSD